MANMAAFGMEVARRRGRRGLRETAAEIGVSPSTLSRIERGMAPDLQSLTKVCAGLRLDPDPYLVDDRRMRRPVASVHFAGHDAMRRDTASALADLILSAQRMIERDAQR